MLSVITAPYVVGRPVQDRERTRSLINTKKPPFSMEKALQNTPAAGLPEEGPVKPYFSQNISNRVPVPVPMRGKARNGSTDQVVRGLETTLFDKQPPAPQLPQHPAQTERPPKSVEQRRPSETESSPPAYQHQHYSSQAEYVYDNEHYLDQNSPFPPPQAYPDDFQSYGEDSASAYIQSYLQSLRPDAPIPPTPHGQTAAPSSSPLVSGYGAGKKGRPMRAGGSTYPFPFGHVRRNRQSQRFPYGNFGANHPSVISEQWQTFAQINHRDMTDSTLSSSTPFQGELYDHWGYIHTNRMTRRFQDPTSLHSSPIHQPISLPIPPSFPGRKKERNLHRRDRRTIVNRLPVLRVLINRETTRELSTFGRKNCWRRAPYCSD